MMAVAPANVRIKGVAAESRVGSEVAVAAETTDVAASDRAAGAWLSRAKSLTVPVIGVPVWGCAPTVRRGSRRRRMMNLPGGVTLVESGPSASRRLCGVDAELKQTVWKTRCAETEAPSKARPAARREVLRAHQLGHVNRSAVTSRNGKIAPTA